MDNIIDRIQQKNFFDYSETFDLYKSVSEYILKDNPNTNKLIINILDNKFKFDKKLNPILTDLLEAIGFYPYLSKEELNLDSTKALIRQEYHYSDCINKYLHEEQKYILELLQTSKNIIVSTPTSFGKSTLIEEIIAEKRFNNIIVIQPTLALLDETRRKLKKYHKDYRIIVRTSQEPSKEKRNLFLFTAERVNEYKYFQDIDFLIIDEFYKLSAKRDDERADSLNNAFNYLLKTFKCKFYLLGPNIDDISPGFIEKYNCIFFKTKTSLVDTKVFDIYSEYKEKFDKPIKNKDYKENILFEKLFANKEEQSIIYCSSPSRVRELSIKYCNFLVNKKIEEINKKLDIIEWIRLNISKDWSLIKLLNHGIGIHDGAMQKHITTSVIEYFNDKKLNYLFCTTTIIEGVNTSAKNIFYFDSTKGKNTKIDFFDYSNIKGRAGRLMVHYIGNIYNFNPTPEPTQIYVDIPFFEQNPITDEILINLNDEEIKDKSSEQYSRLKQIDNKEKEIIKKNGTLVEGQKNIFDILRRDISINYELIAWSTIPTYEQLTYFVDLAWTNLLKPSETTSPMTKKALVFQLSNYARKKDTQELINNTFEFLKKKPSYKEKSDTEILDEAILRVFQTLKHWFEYKVPKWLSVINAIQEFICTEKKIRPGNYNYFASLIESDFLRENLAILYEYGVPSSAIRKLEKLIPSSITQDEVIESIRESEIWNNNIFIQYEKNKIKNL